MVSWLKKLDVKFLLDYPMIQVEVELQKFKQDNSITWSTPNLESKCISVRKPRMTSTFPV